MPQRTKSPYQRRQDAEYLEYQREATERLYARDMANIPWDKCIPGSADYAEFLRTGKR